MVRRTDSSPEGNRVERGGWGPMIAGTLATQVGLLGVLTVISLALGGSQHALACFAGGMAVTLPHAVLASSLWLKTSLTGQLSAASLMLAEGLKLALTVFALYMVVRLLGTELKWVGLLTGVVGALKAQWLALWFTRHT